MGKKLIYLMALFCTITNLKLLSMDQNKLLLSRQEEKNKILIFYAEKEAYKSVDNNYIEPKLSFTLKILPKKTQAPKASFKYFEILANFINKKVKTNITPPQKDNWYIPSSYSWSISQKNDLLIYEITLETSEEVLNFIKNIK